jgi:hypothetical protein
VAVEAAVRADIDALPDFDVAVLALSIEIDAGLEPCLVAQREAPLRTGDQGTMVVDDDPVAKGRFMVSLPCQSSPPNWRIARRRLSVNFMPAWQHAALDFQFTT